MVRNSFENGNFMQPMGRLNMHHERSSFFLFDGRGPHTGLFVFFPCSQSVPKLFPDAFAKMFPIAPGFYPIWFAQSSTPMYINQGNMRKHTFILRMEANLGLSVGVVRNVSKNIGDKGQ